ncbi:hypothetical protein, conserved in T. vivax [Trypanosoma vivax Y486]|uniref:Uncharacterized protein n=1 Tax=Trypanosoma vivax (strain Y486) TaxID=1055687 RepID=F9WKM4_TRYVY|nr:hypothetical protein, conserved in T. vivax [Trypanosoma vivax Y486]|eukprot:CCD18046.1 hypothetical protein, conserved in T. vivax [Trypanosoma vivax Y486]
MEKTRGHPTDSQDATCRHQRGACSLTGMPRQQHGPRIKTAEKHTHIGTAAPRFGKANSDKKHAEEKKKARQKTRNHHRQAGQRMAKQNAQAHAHGRHSHTGASTHRARRPEKGRQQ